MEVVLLRIVLSYLFAFFLYTCAAFLSVAETARLSGSPWPSAGRIWAVQIAALIVSGVMSGLVFRQLAKPKARKHAIWYCGTLLVTVAVTAVIMRATDVLPPVITMHVGYVIGLLGAVLYKPASSSIR